MLDLIVKLRIVHQSTVLFTGIEICALHIAIFHQDQLFLNAGKMTLDDLR